jgi:hypothetical protein
MGDKKKYKGVWCVNVKYSNEKKLKTEAGMGER